MLLLVSSEAVESNLVELETIHIVLLPPTVSILCTKYIKWHHIMVDMPH